MVQCYMALQNIKASNLKDHGLLPLNHLRYLVVSCTMFVKGLNRVPRGLKVSCPQIVNTTPFVNICNFYK
jgi:hypothetical protein